MTFLKSPEIRWKSQKGVVNRCCNDIFITDGQMTGNSGQRAKIGKLISHYV